MKTKFKFILTIAVLSIFTVITQAQPKMHKGPGLPPEITLTEAQQQQIDKINADFHAQMQALKAEQPSEDKKATLEKLRTEHKAALDAILTVEQKQQLEKIHAERKAANEKRLEELNALQQELRTYHEEKVLPILKTQRIKLESKIAIEDQQLIAELRAKHESRPKKMETGIRPFEHRRGSHGRFDDKKTERSRPMPDEETQNKMKALVEKYSADIEALYSEIATEEKKWQEDRKTIFEKYSPKKEDAKAPYQKKARPERTNERGDFHKKLSFLLLSPDAETPAETKQVERKVNTFPNPASEKQTLEFEVVKAGKVLVEIIDQQGNVVKTVFNGNLEQGITKLEIALQDLKNKFYFYRITDAAGVTTKPFMTH
ncbi:MAG: T9SS type A sorting domain-containing protein [Saprospiraceae bacterium]|nr:T9SS type A sorting domain-containing protein [Saprospiraceae bacterium]